MNFAAGDPPSHGFADLIDDVGGSCPQNCVDGVKPQPVEMVFLEPIEGVVDKKIAHRPAARRPQIDRRTPRRLMALGKESGAIAGR